MQPRQKIAFFSRAGFSLYTNKQISGIFASRLFEFMIFRDGLCRHRLATLAKLSITAFRRGTLLRHILLHALSRDASRLLHCAAEKMEDYFAIVIYLLFSSAFHVIASRISSLRSFSFCIRQIATAIETLLIFSIVMTNAATHSTFTIASPAAMLRGQLRQTHFANNY